MSNIEYAYIPGRTIYAVDELAGQFWNTMSSERESFNSAHWSQYAINLSEYAGSGIYSAVYPAGIPAGELSTQIIYQQNGATPTLPGLPGGDSFLSMGQSQGVNLLNINGSGQAAVNLGLATGTEVVGAAVAGTLSTTQMTTDLINANNGAYVGRTIYWTTGALVGMGSVITGYNVTGGKLTFVAVPLAASDGDAFIIT